MKKNLILAGLLSTTMVLSSCMMGGNSNGTLLGGSASNTGSTLATAGTGVLGTLLSSVLGNTTTPNSIAGTWVYSGPKVTFKSENILAQMGSQVASAKIEQSLGNQLKNLGFQAGKSTLTFDSQGNCQMTRSGRNYPGTYTYNQSTGVMTIQGALGVASVSPYVSVIGNEMYVLFEADKLFSVMGTLSTAAKTSTLSSLLNNYNGLQLGWVMTRK